MALSRSDTERQLTRKLQMTRRVGKGQDHRYYDLYIDGRRIAFTKVSTGTGHRTLGPNLVSAMAKQLHVPTPFFEDIINCTKSRNDYLEKLREQRIIN